MTQLPPPSYVSNVSGLQFPLSLRFNDEKPITVVAKSRTLQVTVPTLRWLAEALLSSGDAGIRYQVSLARSKAIEIVRGSWLGVEPH